MIREPVSAIARVLGCAVIALILTSCTTLRVGSDYDRAASFAYYHTFAWMALHTRVNESPNLRVVQRAHERTDLYAYPAPYAGPWVRAGAEWWGAPYWGSEVNVHSYRQGTISVDVFDGHTHRPVWHGWARKELTRDDREHSASSIREAVDSVPARFPPT